MLLALTQTIEEMTRNFPPLPSSSLVVLLILCLSAAGQSGPAPPSHGAQGQPVSYASVTQLNGLLGQLEATSQKTQGDLVGLRIEHWRADGSYKRQALGNVDSIQRNLQDALPTIIAELRSSPEDLPATFKLYRNLDALYDVLGSVTEGAGAFGSKDDLQSLSNDLNSFEGTRKQLADRIDTLSRAKEAEIVRLRADLKTAQAAAPAEPPKKIVVDDTEPEKKPPATTRKKTPAKKPAAQPPAGQGTQQNQQQPPAKQPNQPNQQKPQ